MILEFSIDTPKKRCDFLSYATEDDLLRPVCDFFGRPVSPNYIEYIIKNGPRTCFRAFLETHFDLVRRYIRPDARTFSFPNVTEINSESLTALLNRLEIVAKVSFPRSEDHVKDYLLKKADWLMKYNPEQWCDLLLKTVDLYFSYVQQDEKLSKAFMDEVLGYSVRILDSESFTALLGVKHADVSTCFFDERHGDRIVRCIGGYQMATGSHYSQRPIKISPLLEHHSFNPAQHYTVYDLNHTARLVPTLYEYILAELPDVPISSLFRMMLMISEILDKPNIPFPAPKKATLLSGMILRALVSNMRNYHKQDRLQEYIPQIFKALNKFIFDSRFDAFEIDKNNRQLKHYIAVMLGELQGFKMPKPEDLEHHVESVILNYCSKVELSEKTQTLPAIDDKVAPEHKKLFIDYFNYWKVLLPEEIEISQARFIHHASRFLANIWYVRSSKINAKTDVGGNDAQIGNTTTALSTAPHQYPVFPDEVCLIIAGLKQIKGAVPIESPLDSKWNEFHFYYRDTPDRSARRLKEIEWRAQVALEWMRTEECSERMKEKRRVGRRSK